MFSLEGCLICCNVLKLYALRFPMTPERAINIRRHWEHRMSFDCTDEWIERMLRSWRYDHRDTVQSAVYFIKCQDFIKIGRAEKPLSRLIDLQLANPLPLSMVATIEAPTYAAKLIERMLHEQHAPHCVRGEWFSLTLDQVEFSRQQGAEVLPRVTAIRAALMEDAGHATKYKQQREEKAMIERLKSEARGR